MKSTFSVSLALLAAGAAEAASPVAKVLEMLSNLQGKIIGEGQDAQRVYEEFSEWCEERAKSLQFDIKEGTSEAGELTATIKYEDSEIERLTAKIEELSAAIATDEADLKAATEIRTRENGDFVASEKDLTGIIDTLERAIGILERDQRKKGASMIQQLNGAASVAQALNIMVQASMLNTADSQRLTALIQSSDGDDDAGAPAGAVYKGQSGGIIQTMEGLLDKAQGQLETARHAESDSQQNYDMLKQSLEDQIKFANGDLADSKKESAGSAERKAAAEGDLGATNKELNGATSTLNDVHHHCMSKAQDFEAETKSRDDELKALADAKKVIGETTGGADDVTYGLNQMSPSFLELSSSADLSHFEAIRFVRDLARKENSKSLALLAQRMASAMRASHASGNDPFQKVKGLIRDMLSKLEDEASRDATHEAYCDKEIAESNVKHEDKSAEIAKLSGDIDQMSARSAQLKQEVATLMKELANLADSQAEMDRIRKEENSDFEKTKADMERGLEGIKTALQILTEYYGAGDKAHAAAQGAGEGIIGLLEVVESDFSKGLAEAVATEENAQAAYEGDTKRNELDKTAKDQDVNYKNKEAKDLDKAVSEDESDRASVQSEVDAVNEYLTQLHKECDEVAEPYAESKRRRDAELAGLREALEILSGEAVLLQQNQRRARSEKGVRGVRSHARA